ncbi:hypothetical protein ACFVXA_04225 [Streptomyces sp. NPDC058246]|uniref:hypothetical protein n=1 Tax=unclassified Streptomyces TaxID=2593676 RepID=UPI0036516583
MNRAERRLLALLRQLAERDFVVLSDLGGSPRRLAVLTYVAEQHGFRYAEAHRVGRALQVQLVRAERADPRPPESVSVPGLRPGTLRPGPEAAATVRRLRDRIELEVMAEDPSMRSRAVIMTVCSLFMGLCLLLSGWQTALAGFAGAEAFFLGFLYLEVVRRRKLARRVHAAA